MANKKIGIKSSAQDNFLEPNAVTSLTASDVGTSKAYEGGEASLSWSLPAASPPATLYTITTTPQSTTQTTTNTSYTFTGLTAGSYTFTVVASNNAGSSQPTTSSSVAITTVPQTMSAPTASSPNANQDVVSWTAPSDGGKSITGYVITSSDGPTYSAGSGDSSITINETANTTQTYTIYATNANGNGAQSPSSNSITTTAPFFPPFFPYFPPYFPFFPPFFPYFPYFPPFFPYFPPFFPYFPYFPPFFPYFPPFFPYFPYFPPFFPYFPPGFGPYFPPFFPYFPPSFKSYKCIAGDTLLLTADRGWVPVAGIAVGDKILTVDPKFMGEDETRQDINALPKDISFIEVEVVKNEKSQKTLIQFNELEARFSENQPIFVKVGDKIKYKNTGDVEIGDILVCVIADPASAIEYIEVTKITKTEDEHDVYDIRTSDVPWYIAGKFLTIA